MPFDRERYEGYACVAVFQKDMENAAKLLSRLDEPGLLTTYGTGDKTDS